jgi:crotonobetaine/carnitine-CoA ligase
VTVSEHTATVGTNFGPAPELGEAVIGHVLAVRSRLHPQKRFITCGATTWTYGEMQEISGHVAAGFGALGISKGDRIAILTPNRPEMFELYFGLARLGVVQVPLNAFIKGNFLKYQLADSEASTLVTDAPGLEASMPLLADLPNLTHIVLLDEDGSTGDRPVPSTTTMVPFAELRRCPDPVPVVEVAPADIMSILYTSGTTGLPKGCMLPHGYYFRVAELVATGMEQTADDVLYTALPAFHAMARMMVVAGALSRGSTAVVEEQFHPSTFLERAVEVGATMGFGVGTTGVLLLATPPSDIDRAHSLRSMMLGPFSAQQQGEFSARFGIDPYAEIYGQTECVGITWDPISGPRKRDTVGRESSDLEVCLLDDDGRQVATGAAGEICLRPRGRFSMFDGYWRKPQATVDATRGLWFHTGDYGRSDEDGFFYFIDRKKDAIRRRGENISSFEVEEAIIKHPSIREVAIHGISTGSTEDDVVAVLVVEPGQTLDPSELHDFFSTNLPYFAVPRYVRILDQLPRNAVMRVMKFQLRELAVDDSVWDLAQMGHSTPTSRRR